jgi:hypothetical protein
MALAVAVLVGACDKGVILMAFTDHSDLYGAVHEDGINNVVRHIMAQRPSLVNYATPIFHQRPDLFCTKIAPAQSVIDSNNPLFTEQEPLPILGTPVPMGVNFCVQLTGAQIDFHPTNVFQLPAELGDLGQQRFAMRGKACAGVDCPSKDIIDEYLPGVERLLLAEQKLAVGTVRERQQVPSGSEHHTSGVAVDRGKESGGLVGVIVPPREAPPARPEPVIVLPTRKLICFCLEVFATGHFEWGTVPGSQEQWLKPKLDGIEIVDIQPNDMENAIECYIATILRLGILPQLMIPMSKMVLDVAAQVKKWGLDLGKQVKLQPAAVPGDIPNNPAVEEDQLRVFIDLVIS